MRPTKIRELKDQARLLLNGKYPFLALITAFMIFSYVMLNYLLLSAFPTVPGIFGFVLYLAALVLCNMVYFILQAGMIRLYLKLCRGEAFRFSDLFSVFSNRPESVAAFSVLQLILQSALLYICDRALGMLLDVARGEGFPLLPFVLALLLGVILIWLMLHLSLVLFLHCDEPWKPLTRLIKESWQMMHGNLGRMFYLLLSFLGVGILCLLSLGIGVLFAVPYLQTAQALFYLDLCARGAAQQTM